MITEHGERWLAETMQRRRACIRLVRPGIWLDDREFVYDTTHPWLGRWAVMFYQDGRRVSTEYPWLHDDAMRAALRWCYPPQPERTYVRLHTTAPLPEPPRYVGSTGAVTVTWEPGQTFLHMDTDHTTIGETYDDADLWSGRYGDVLVTAPGSSEDEPLTLTWDFDRVWE